MEAANQQIILAEMTKFGRQLFGSNRRYVPPYSRFYVNEKSGLLECAAHFGESDPVGVEAGASHEFGFVGTVDAAARLRRTLVERVLTRCEIDEETAEPLLTLLRRFAAESAREDARAFDDEPPADQPTAAQTEHGLIAA